MYSRFPVSGGKASQTRSSVDQSNRTVAPVVEPRSSSANFFLPFYLTILDSCTSRCLIEANRSYSRIWDSSMETSSLSKITKYAGGEDSRRQVIFGEEINEKTRALLSKLPEQSSRVGR